MKYVEEQLAKNPGISNQELQEGAKKLDRSVGQLSIRQFHAKYPLQVKRRSGGGRKATRKGKATPKGKATRKGKATPKRRTSSGRGRTRRSAAVSTSGGANENVRRIMLQFARELSGADSQVATIEVLSKLDRYVADIVKAAQR